MKEYQIARKGSAWWGALAVLLVAGVDGPSVAAAQEAEVAGEARGNYAWSGGGETDSSAEAGVDPLRIMAYAGAGVGARLVRNLDAPFQQSFMVPPYLDIGGAVFFEGTDVRFGPSLYLSTNLMQDGGDGGTLTDAPAPGQQWAVTPGFSLMIPFQRLLGMETDLLQLQARVGVPLVIGTSLTGDRGETDFTVGFELGLALHLKVLAGFGFYVEAQADVFGGANDPLGAPTVHPLLAFDAGLLLDYEVLP